MRRNPTRNIDRLVQALLEDPNLLDEAVLGGRIDADIAEYAYEFNCSKRRVQRAILIAIDFDNQNLTRV